MGFDSSGFRMYKEEEAWLECQDCGEALRQLTQKEVQAVANAPYDYVFLCARCRKESYGD